MALPLVAILCGSPADGAHAEQIADAARSFGCEAVIRIASAHRTPEHALAVLQSFEAAAAERPVAGRSNALSGFADPQISVPVIACPPPSDTHATVDVWSSLRMPAGVAPVVVLEPVNAAIAAAKMIGLVDPVVRDAVRAYQSKARQRVLDGDAAAQL